MSSSHDLHASGPAPADPDLRQAVRSGGDVISAWLLGRGEPPEAAALQEAGLAGYAYTALPPSHPARAALRPAYLSALSRHHALRRSLMPLLRAWNEAGVDVLLWRGLHLAEFVYPAPGARFHGDVDVLVRPEQLPEALCIARALGWVEQEALEAGHPFWNTAATLHGPGGWPYLEVHRYAVHRRSPWNRAPRRITEAVWSRARTRRWEDVVLHELDPVHALLVGLVLQRCWSGDAWHLKPHDLTDFRLLRAQIPAGQLEAEARALGVSRTFRLFRARCDPEAGRFELTPPSRRRRLGWDLRALPERAPRWVDHRLYLVHQLVPTVVNVAAALPVVVQAVRAIARHRDMRRLLESLTPAARPGPVPTDVRRRVRTVRGIRWALRLLRVRRDGNCLPRSLAVYAALRRQGWPVVFASGVRRDAPGVLGHAWVELEGRVLPELHEPDNPERYRVNFRFP